MAKNNDKQIEAAFEDWPPITEAEEKAFADERFFQAHEREYLASKESGVLPDFKIAEKVGYVVYTNLQGRVKTCYSYHEAKEAAKELFENKATSEVMVTGPSRDKNGVLRNMVYLSFVRGSDMKEGDYEDVCFCEDQGGFQIVDLQKKDKWLSDHEVNVRDAETAELWS